MTVMQNSDQAIVEWSDFSIGSSASVYFDQPGRDAVILNRVTGPDQSQIFGSMTGTGQVFLLNPAGVVFGKGSSVNVGSLVAGTMTLNNEDFLEKNYRFTRNGSTASVENYGNLSVLDRGAVVLLGATVKNEGEISARLGSVMLSSGEAVTLSFGQDGLWSVALEPSAVASMVRNSGTITADGGNVVLSASSASGVTSSVVNDSGVIQARTIGAHDGVIRLMADNASGLVQVGGIIDANGAGAGDRGGSILVSGGFVAMGGKVSADGATGGSIDIRATGTLSLAENVSATSRAGHGGEVHYRAGGRITEISGSHTDVSGLTDGGEITVNAGYGLASSGGYVASGITGRGGRIDVTAPDVRLLSARFDASGASQGGLVRIGGAFQGGSTSSEAESYYTGFVGRWGSLLPSLNRASQTFINSGVTIDVSSSAGVGGTAVVWSDDRTIFLGSVEAAGGSGGGYVEISSAEELRQLNLVDVHPGVGGTLLLDPKNITIGSDTETVKAWNYAGIMGAFYGGPASSSKDLSLSLDGVGESNAFATGVALNGDGSLLAVGGWDFDGADNTIINSGSVYLFSFDKPPGAAFTNGKLEGIIGPGYTGGKNIDMSQWVGGADHFGFSLSFNSAGTLLAVGATAAESADNSLVDLGAVYLFSFNDPSMSTPFETHTLGTVGRGYTGTRNINVSTLEVNDYFGSGVSLSGDGNWLAVGAYGDDGASNSMTDAGAVYLFKLTHDSSGNYTGGTSAGTIGYGYTGARNINMTQLEKTDIFGISVALNNSGTVLAVGADADDGFNNESYNSGSVYLFKLNYENGNYTGGAHLGTIGYGYTGTYDLNLDVDRTLGTVATNDVFGRSISLSGDALQLVVGAYGDDGFSNSKSNSGSVYLFRLGYDAGTGFYTGATHVGTIGSGYTNISSNRNINMSLDEYDYFGYAVSLSTDGRRLVVGAYNDDGYANLVGDSGAAHLFSFTGSDYSGGSLIGTVGSGYLGTHNVNVHTNISDYFGYSVSLNGDGRLMAVGAIGDDGYGNSVIDSGAVYLFSFTGANYAGGTLESVFGHGYLSGKNVNVSLDAHDHFGTSVSLNSAGTQLAIGASGDDGAGNGLIDSGAVYLFNLNYIQATGVFTSASPSGIIRSGYALSGTTTLTLEAGDHFGSSVSLNGDGRLMAIGAFGDDGSGNSVIDSGAAYLFSYSGTAFSGVPTMTAVGNGYSVNVSLAKDDWFGRSVALNDSGKLLAVGASGDDGATNGFENSGALYLFTFGSDFSGSMSVGTIGRNYSTPLSLDKGDYFGQSVSLDASGTLLAVGATGDDTVGNSATATGAVYLYSLNYIDATGAYSGATFRATLGYNYVGGKNVNVSLRQGDNFGNSVSLSGDGKMLAVGASGDDSFGHGGCNAGALYLFSFTDTAFSAGSLQATFRRDYARVMFANLSVGLENNDFFGSTVALSDNGQLMAVGANGDDGFENLLAASGSVYLFSFSGTDFSAGQLRGIIGAGYSGGNNVSVDLKSADSFGKSLALNGSGNILAVGADMDDGDDGSGNTINNSGAVYLFRFTGTNFAGGTQQAIIGSGASSRYSVQVALNANDNFGTAVSLNSTGTMLAVGAMNDDGFSGNVTNSGAVYLFRFGYDSATGAFTSGSKVGTIGSGYSETGDINLSLDVGERFGSAVSLSNIQNGTFARFAVGAQYDDGVNNSLADSGAVYLFNLNYNAGIYTGGVHAGTIGSGYIDAGTVKGIAISQLEKNDNFGHSVAISRDGARLAVGAFFDDGFGNGLADSGAVYLIDLHYSPDGTLGSGSLSGIMGYDYTKDVTLPGNINVGVLNWSDVFGCSVAFNGDGTLLAVGAYGDNGYGESLAGGGVHLFQLSHDSASFTGGTLLGTIGFSYPAFATNMSLSVGSDKFGDSVSLSGDGRMLAVGASLDDGFTNLTSNAGAVYLFGFRDNTYSGGTLCAVIGSGYGVPVTLEAGDNFGTSVSLSRDGSILAVGAPGDDGSGNSSTTNNNYGAVYLFKLNYASGSYANCSSSGTIGSGYSGTGTFLNTLDTDDAFGSSVSLNSSGTTIAIGATGDDGNGISSTTNNNYGAVYLFGLSYGSGSYSGVSAGTIGSGFSFPLVLDKEDAFGSSVSLNSDGTMLAIGAPGDDGYGNASTTNNNYGAVWLFGLSQSVWSNVGMIGHGYYGLKDRHIDLSVGDAFGGSLSFNGQGTKLAVGTELHDAFDALRGVGYSDTGMVYILDLTYETGVYASSSLHGRIGLGLSQTSDLSIRLETNDNFGSAVSFNSDGSMLAVGASGDDGMNNDLTGSGALYLLKEGDPVSQTFSSVSGDESYDMFGHQEVSLRASEIATFLGKGSNLVLQANNDIYLNSAITVTGTSGGDLTLQAGRSIALNANIITGNGNLFISANEGASYGVISQYRDRGEAVVTMSHGTTIDAGTGDVIITLRNGQGNTYTSSGNIELETISANRINVVNNGSSSGSGIVLRSTLTAAGSGDAIVLAGQSFINNKGSDALVVGNGGRWLVWSGDPRNDVRGNLSYDFKQYNATFGSTPVNPSATGNGFLYTIAPVITYDLVGTVSREYDGTILATNLTSANHGLTSKHVLIDGIVVGSSFDGDTVTLTAPSDIASGRFANKNKGTGIQVTSAGLAMINSATANNAAIRVYGYGVTYASGNVGEITKRTLTGTSIASVTTTYGTDHDAGQVSFSNVVANDDVSATAIIEKEAGDLSTSGNLKAGDYRQRVTESGLSGADADNYTIDFTTLTRNYTVDKRSLSGSIGASHSTYGDGYTYGAATVSGVITNDVIGTATVSLGDLTNKTSTSGNLRAGTYSDLEVVSGYDGVDASNYDFSGVKGDYTVDKLALSGSIGASHSTYGDGYTYGSATVSGVITNDVIGTATVSLGDLTNKKSTSGNLRAGTYSGLEVVSGYDGVDAGNYDFSGVKGDYTVDKRSLSGTIASGNSIYGDGYTYGAATVSGVINNDLIGTATVSLGDLTNKKSTSGNLRAGTYSGLEVVSSYSGVDALNYDYSGVTGDYTVDKLALGGSIGASHSTYGDGYTYGAATVSGVITNDVIGTAMVSLGDLTNKKSTSGNLRAGTYSGLEVVSSYSGVDASNYDFSGVKGDYTVDKLAVVGNIASGNSTYGDGYTYGAATVSGVITNDVIGTATVSLGDLTNKKSTSGHLRAGTYSGLEVVSGYDGVDASNYDFSGVKGDYTVDKLAVVGSIGSGHSTYGDGYTYGSSTVSGVITSDVIGTATVSLGDLTNKTSTSGHLRAGTYSGLEVVSSYSGVDAGNYDFSGVTGDYTVDKRQVTGTSISEVTTTYGTDHDAGTVSLGNVVGNDVVSSAASIVSPEYSVSQHLKAGSYFQRASTIMGTDTANYNFSGYTTSEMNYHVIPASLTVTAKDDVIDSDQSPYWGGGGVVYAGLVTGEDESVLDGLVIYSGSSQGAEEPGIYTITPGGLESSDYAIVYVDGKLTINRSGKTPTVALLRTMMLDAGGIWNYTTRSLWQVAKVPTALRVTYQ